MCVLVPTNRVECTWATIPNGGVRTVTLITSVDPNVQGGTVIENTGIINSDTPDSDLSNNQDPQDITVDASADVGVTKSDDPDPVIAGNLLTYQLIVRNNGPSAARNVRAIDNLPAEVSFVSANPSAGSCVYNAGLNRIVCTFGRLQPGAAVRTVDITVQVDPSTPAGVINNTVRVTTSTPDPNAANDTDTEPTTILTSADLRLEKSVDPVAVVSGDNVVWTVSVTNDGPSDAQAVSVVDTLPAGFTFVADTDSCVEGPVGTLTCSLGTLSAGSSTSFDIHTTVSASVAPGTYVNSATASSTTPDPDPSDNADTAEVGVTALADLRITKFASPAGPVPAGTPILYTIYVDNLGPSVATGVTMADAITSNGNFIVNSIVSDRAATCTPATPTAPANSRTVNCALTAPLEPQSLGTGRWTITVSITANSAQTLNNIATTTSQTPDPDPTNNRGRAEPRRHGLGGPGDRQERPVPARRGRQQRHVHDGCHEQRTVRGHERRHG